MRVIISTGNGSFGLKCKVIPDILQPAKFILDLFNQFTAHGIQATVFFSSTNAYQHVDMLKTMHLVTKHFFGIRRDGFYKLMKLS